MNTKARKSREKELRRNALLDAAEEVIFSKGIEHATMDEIAEKAEFSKGTLYYYFNDKTDLYLAINNRGLTILTEQFASVIAEDRTGLKMVKRLGEVYLRFVREYPDYFHTFMYHENSDILVNQSSKMANKCENMGKKAFTFAVRAFQIGIQDGTINSAYQPERLALQFWGSLRGIMQLFYYHSDAENDRIFENEDLEVEPMFNDFISIFLRGIQNQNNNN
ncbi:MAG: TetR/AcrR family transcriptional regulator [Candidatus Marinimicrobia bacterium]|nr:TetR/AcrR family transcriptional regulator [Candidatus Neomarinimicrobiota bacterium]MCF7828234.1 TetR/AcrR family transcriptional regulator [Candidatus Neomarinimicrobiota bacterium]MCF7879591.1 TetR/AcrR family transcriptional regulator [Candidatus Neomarinimicrobiota bacterium]